LDCEAAKADGGAGDVRAKAVGIREEDEGSTVDEGRAGVGAGAGGLKRAADSVIDCGGNAGKESNLLRLKGMCQRLTFRSGRSTLNGHVLRVFIKSEPL